MPEKNDDLPSLEALSRKIEQAQPDEGATPKPGKSYEAYALRFTMDLFAGLLAGALLGYGADWLLGTTPWVTLAGVCLGLGAGIRNMMRVAKEMEEE